MRYLPVLLILFVIAACTSTPVPDLTASNTPEARITADTQTPDATATARPLMSSQVPPSCPDAPAIRLLIQGRGRVLNNDDEDNTLNLRTGPGTSFTVRTALPAFQVFSVIEGPTCAEGFSWFRVRAGNNIGWIAEGDSDEYYVEPYLAG